MENILDNEGIACMQISSTSSSLLLGVYTDMHATWNRTGLHRNMYQLLCSLHCHNMLLAWRILSQAVCLLWLHDCGRPIRSNSGITASCSLIILNLNKQAKVCSMPPVHDSDSSITDGCWSARRIPARRSKQTMLERLEYLACQAQHM